MSGRADNVPEGTVRGTRLPRGSSSQPYIVESLSGGDSRSAAFHNASIDLGTLVSSCFCLLGSTGVNESKYVVQ